MLKDLLDKINPEVLDEAMKLQVTALFEDALNESVEEEKSLLEDKLESTNRAEIRKFKEGLVNHIDKYLTEMVRKFVSENKGLVENKVKVKKAEKIIEKFSTLLTDFTVSLAENKAEKNSFDYKLSIDKQKEKINKLYKVVESKDAQIEKIKTIKNSKIGNLKKALIISEGEKELETDSQKAKLKELAKHIKAANVDEYIDKVDSLIESISSRSTERMFESKKAEADKTSSDLGKKPVVKKTVRQVKLDESVHGDADKLTESVDPVKTKYEKYL